MLCKARWAQMPAERAHTFLATPSRMQNHRSKERRAAQRRLYSRLSTLKRRTSCGRGTPCINTTSEAIPSIMLRETPDDRRVAPPGLHCMTIVVVWKRFVKKMNLKNLRICNFFLMKLQSFRYIFGVYLTIGRPRLSYRLMGGHKRAGESQHTREGAGF